MKRSHKVFHKGKFSKTSYTGKKFHRSAGSAKVQEISHTKLLEQEIIAYLYQEKEPQNMVNIMNALSLSHSDRKILSHLLADLCRQEKISCPRSKKRGTVYTLAKKSALAEGVVEVHPRALVGDRARLWRRIGGGLCAARRCV